MNLESDMSFYTDDICFCFRLKSHIMFCYEQYDAAIIHWAQAIFLSNSGLLEIRCLGKYSYRIYTLSFENVFENIVC